MVNSPLIRPLIRLIYRGGSFGGGGGTLDSHEKIIAQIPSSFLKKNSKKSFLGLFIGSRHTCQDQIEVFFRRMRGAVARFSPQRENPKIVRSVREQG